MLFRHAVISFWYKELQYNPICKINDLENSLAGYLQVPFLINKKEPFVNISLPRIVASSHEKNCLFNMTLVNMNLDINFNDECMNDLDMMVLYINERLQLLYDVLKEIYDLEIVYTSIKLEMTEEVDNVIEIQSELLKDVESGYEDFMLKKGICYDNKYYINEVTTTSKEVNFDINFPKNIKPNEGDMLARSMLISLKDAKIGKSIKGSVLEINDRLSYNKDPNYRVSKDSLRDIIFEFKSILKEKIKD